MAANVILMVMFRSGWERVERRGIGGEGITEPHYKPGVPTPPRGTLQISANAGDHTPMTWQFSRAVHAIHAVLSAFAPLGWLSSLAAIVSRLIQEDQIAVLSQQC